VYHFVLNAGFASAWGAQKGWSFNSPSWSVSVEILLYLVFFIAAYLRKGSAMSCLLISSAAFILRYYVPSSLLFNGLSMFFFGGFVFYVTLLLSRRSEGWINFVLGAAAVLWAGVWINYYMFDFGSDIMNLGYLGVVIVKYIFPNYVLFPATICALALIEIRKKTFWKPLSWIGDISFSAYLLHFPLQLAFGLAVGYGILGASFYLHPFYLMLYFSLLVLLSCLSYRKFERPIQNLLRSKFESRKGTQPPKAIE
jgi:peptidoglycan/LPS O-acetylase OafA/YrhL